MSCALVTLITPVIALVLGSLLNDEPLTARRVQGGGLICIGLAVYSWGDRYKHRGPAAAAEAATKT